MYFKIITKVTYSTYCMLSLWHKPTPLKLNWATGSVITDGCRAWLWFLMTQKFTNFKMHIFTLWAPMRCSCRMNACADICSLNSGTCTLESTSTCMLCKLKHKSSKTTTFILLEIRCWNTRICGLGHWKHVYRWKTRKHSHMLCGFTSYCYYKWLGLIDEMSKYEVNQDTNTLHCKFMNKHYPKFLTPLRGCRGCKEVVNVCYI